MGLILVGWILAGTVISRVGSILTSGIDMDK